MNATALAFQLRTHAITAAASIEPAWRAFKWTFKVAVAVLGLLLGCLLAAECWVSLIQPDAAFLPGYEAYVNLRHPPDTSSSDWLIGVRIFLTAGIIGGGCLIESNCQFLQMWWRTVVRRAGSIRHD